MEELKMVSNKLYFTKMSDNFRNIPAEAEKVAVFNELSHKKMLRLRLLAEELIGMMSQLVKYGDGEFWIENEGEKYELHIKLINKESVDREKLLSVSSTGKNAAAKGIMGKLICAVEYMIDERSKVADAQYDFYGMGMMQYGDYAAWSLMNYRNNVDEASNEEAWDELEKSIIANLSDDVVVGIIGQNINVIVKKDLSKI